MNVYFFLVLELKTSKKISVCLYVRNYVRVSRPDAQYI